MRISSVLLLLIFSIELNVIFNNSAAESFVTIPAWVAFGAITAAVKLKLILVKIMFALRTMGIGSIRIKRSAPGETIQQHISDATELLGAWRELEATAGRSIIFKLDVCIDGVETGRIFTQNIPSHLNPSPMSPSSQAEIDGYSKFVSSVIGSMTRSVAACHVLNEALVQSASHGSLTAFRLPS